MRETLLGKVINTVGPIRSSPDLQELAEKESIQNNRQGPSYLSPPNALVREFIRDIAHPFFLRNETYDPRGGLKRLHALQEQGMGTVVIEMHFSQIDPLWAMDAVTKKHGKRSIPLVQPLAADRDIPGLLPLSKAAGIDIVKVVTPDVKDRADKKNPENTLKVGDGQDEFIHRAIEVVKNGGIADVPPKATREDHLEESSRDQAVTSLLLSRLYRAGVTNVAVHFVAFNMEGMKGPEDYKKRRKYNIGKRHTSVHGNTFTLAELIDIAAGPVVEGERPRSRALRGLANMEPVVFNQLSQIAPSSYKVEGSESASTGTSFNPEDKPTLKLSNESIAATLGKTFKEFDAGFIRQLVDEAAANNKLGIPVTPLVERRLRDIRRERDGKSV